jgi:hypothetical protein
MSLPKIIAMVILLQAVVMTALVGLIWIALQMGF